MSEYTPGTVLEDKDEDRWVVIDERLAHYNGEPDNIWLISSIEEFYSPLKVLEEAVSWAELGTAADRIISVSTSTEAINGFMGNTISEFTAGVPEDVVNKAAVSSGDDFPSDAFSVFDEAFNVLLRKNADYGPSNIADSPGGPLNGILVRMWDKMSRLRHLVESGATPENESLRDTLMDMANYSLIAMIVLDGNWPGMPDE